MRITEIAGFMDSPGSPVARSRWRYAIAVAVTIVAGLASRAYADYLPW